MAFSAVFTVSPLAHALTLNEALSTALETNPAYLAKKEEQQQAAAEVKIRQGIFLPQVDALGTLVLKDRRSFDNGNVVETEPRSATLRVRQNIFSGGKDSAKLAEAKRRLYAAEAGLYVAEQNTLLNSITAYLDVLLAREVLSLNIFQINLLGQQAEEAQKRFEVGEITKTDVTQAQARLAAQRASTLASQGDVRTKEAIFAEIIGTYPEGLTWPDLSAYTLPEEFEGLEEKAFAQNPNLTNAVALLAAEKQVVKAAKANYLPDITAEVSVARREGAFSVLGNGNSDEFNATLNASFPLFRGGATVNSVKKARARTAELHALYTQRQREIKRDLTEAYHMLQAAKAEFASRQEATKATQLAYEGVSQEAKAGIRTTLDQLDAEEELLQAKVSEIQARHQQIYWMFKLFAALGELREGRIL